MNLGVFEAHLIEALRPRLPGHPSLQTGPAHASAATAVRPEVFVHGARFDDLGGATADGAVIARHAWQPSAAASGFAEDRPARIEIDVTFVGALLWQVQALAGLAAAVLLRALETLDGAALGAVTDAADAVDAADAATTHSRLHFTNHRAVLQRSRSERHEHNGVAVHHVVLTLRLDGFLQLRLAAAGGLVRRSAHAALAPTIDICFDSAGTDLQREHVLLRNPAVTLLNLAGWSIEDSARRPHRYRFAPLALLPAGGELRLWSGRGADDARNLYWGRRLALWRRSGDAAILRDPDGVERRRATCSPAAPPAQS